MNHVKFLALMLFLAFLLTACGGTGAPGGDPAAAAVNSYLQGVVSKNVSQVSSLSCKQWEPMAIQELDSLQAVKAELKDVSCKKSGTDGAAALVSCQGSIAITYDKEQQMLDLAGRVYRVVQEGGDWRMCGYQP